MTLVTSAHWAGVVKGPVSAPRHTGLARHPPKTATALEFLADVENPGQPKDHLAICGVQASGGGRRKHNADAEKQTTRFLGAGCLEKRFPSGVTGGTCKNECCHRATGDTTPRTPMAVPGASNECGGLAFQTFLRSHCGEADW